MPYSIYAPCNASDSAKQNNRNRGYDCILKIVTTFSTL